jgi:hypothetical protein
MNEVVAKHQQVPVEDWFFTGVAFNSTTFVKIYPSSVLAAGVTFFCAFAVSAIVDISRRSR